MAVDQSVTMMGTNRARWTPARIFLCLGGGWLLVVGIVGFALNSTFPIGAAEAQASHSAHIFGVFETNGWHNLAAMLFAVVALPVVFLRPDWSRSTAMMLGVVHVGVTLGLSLWDPSTFWVASNSADQVVHAGYAVGGIATAMATPKVTEARA